MYISMMMYLNVGEFFTSHIFGEMHDIMFYMGEIKSCVGD
jgi:hypothetical protein